MSDVPSLDVFRNDTGGRPRNTGKWQALLNAMRPNEPVDIGDEVQSTVNADAVAFRQAARRMQRRIALRTVEGRVWACWLVDES